MVDMPNVHAGVCVQNIHGCVGRTGQRARNSLLLKEWHTNTFSDIVLIHVIDRKVRSFFKIGVVVKR